MPYINKNNPIAQTLTLKEAESIAEKHEGNEIIVKEKGKNTYSVFSVKVEVKNLDQSKYDTNVFEFSVQDNKGKSHIIEPLTSIENNSNKNDNSDLYSEEREDKALSCYVDQKNGLASSEGDCGPASASMILKLFGFLKGKSDESCISTVRGACEVSRARNGKWAINESEVQEAIIELSKGKITLGNKPLSINSTKSLPQNKKEQMAIKVQNYVRDALKKGQEIIIEGGYIGKSRHYMVVAGMLKDGTLMMLDPYNPKQKIVPLDRKKLMDYMDNTSNPTVVMPFTKKS
ncbi:MAG: papain-like cysteine protease family protein [Candidatus Sericytochromatia bacterium]